MLEIGSFALGEWQKPAARAETLIDAASGEVIGRIGHDGLPFAEMLEFAREKGGAGLRAMGFHDRARMIKSVALMLKENREALYELSYHSGATKSDSAIDIEGGIQTMLVFASKGRREMPDSSVYIDGNIEELSRDESFKGMHIATPLLGCAVHINAFNFPIWGMVEKLAQSWLAGMPAIVKPASSTAYLSECAVRLMLESGLLPEGALQMIAGSTGDLLEHVGTQDVVSFTGSEATGQMLRAHPNLIRHSTRFIAEQDSINASVLAPDIAADSEDFGIFIREVTREITAKCGQKCTAIRRIFVPVASMDAVIEALRARLAKINPADPRDKDTKMGALVSLAQCKEVMEKAREIGKEAKLVIGEMGDAPEKGGAFLKPMVFLCEDVAKAKRIHEIEAFGPVATIIPYERPEEAIAGLAMGGGSLVASVITRSPELAREFALHAAPFHGRLYFNNALSAKAATGHGSPLPHLIHGGPGRAGGGAEMGGIRGVLNYMNRTAIQGHPDLLSAIGGRYVPGAAIITKPEHPFTRHFEELEIGEVITTDSREITLDDIEHFAKFTGDHFYAHMIEEAASSSPFFEGRVAHGYLILAFAAGLFVEPSPGPVLANTGLDRLRFLKPVAPGDRIRARLIVMGKTRRNAEYGEVRWQVEIDNQEEERVAEYELLTMNARKGEENEQ